MSAVLTLGLRLVRAGGALRAWSIVAGNAVGTALLMLALALPVAIHPDAVDRNHARVQLLGIDLFLLLPAVVLLVTVGRLSSGVRDRRLAALRMIGVSPARTRAVAAVENGSLALTGGAVGAVAAALVLPTASHAVVGGPGWLAQPVQLSAATAVVVAVGVSLLSVVVGTGASWDRELPGRARSEAEGRTPRARRLAVLVVGLAMLGSLLVLDLGHTGSATESVLLVGGGVVTAVGIALATPLLTAWVARGLVRSRGVVTTLAARAVQTDPAGASRVVAGLGVATFLTVGALGVIAAFEGTPQYRYGLNALEDGPQKVRVFTDDTLDPTDLATVTQVPGVHGVVPDRQATLLPCDWDTGAGCEQVFVGTCAQLDLVLESSGCDDTRAAWIVDDGADPQVATLMTDAGHIDPTRRIDVVRSDDGGSGRAPVALGLAPASDPIEVDTRAQGERWVYDEGSVAFVPLALAGDVVGPVGGADVVADGGVAVQQRVVAWAQEHGYGAEPYPTDDVEYVDQVTVAVLSLAGVSIAVGLLVLVLTAADRTVERRRAVARQVMVGVPGRVLRSGQLVQVLIPSVVAATLGIGAGLLLADAYTRMGGEGVSVGVDRWGSVAVLVGVGVLLVALATVPMVRTRLSPELLRRE